MLVPTRELADQVHNELLPLAAELGLRLLTVYGGVSPRRQVQELRRGVDVVVATPGRLLDLLSQRACSLDAVAVAVLDEADHMADLGFLPAVTSLLDLVPRGGQRLLFSATLDGQVDGLVRRYLTDPVRHQVVPTAAAAALMEHQVRTVEAADKVAVAAELASRPGRTLLFVRTKHRAARLARQLGNAGLRAGALHGDLAQPARARALAAFTSGTVPVLVATDIAARGIHVDGIDLVVHFDPPAEPKAYLHRSGRTARAGAEGTVVTLVLPEQATEVAALHRRAGVGGPPLPADPTTPRPPSRTNPRRPGGNRRRRRVARPADLPGVAARPAAASATRPPAAGPAPRLLCSPGVESRRVRRDRRATTPAERSPRERPSRRGVPAGLERETEVSLREDPSGAVLPVGRPAAFRVAQRRPGRALAPPRRLLTWEGETLTVASGRSGRASGQDPAGAVPQGLAGGAGADDPPGATK